MAGGGSALVRSPRGRRVRWNAPGAPREPHSLAAGTARAVGAIDGVVAEQGASEDRRRREALAFPVHEAAWSMPWSSRRSRRAKWHAGATLDSSVRRDAGHPPRHDGAGRRCGRHPVVRPSDGTVVFRIRSGAAISGNGGLESGFEDGVTCAHGPRSPIHGPKAMAPILHVFAGGRDIRKITEDGRNKSSRIRRTSTPRDRPLKSNGRSTFFVAPWNGGRP